MLVSQVRYHFSSLESSAAPLRWVLGNWDVSGIFQAQSGAPFDVRTAVDIAGVGPGSGNQFYDWSAIRTACEPIGTMRWRERPGSTRTRSALRRPAPTPRRSTRTSCASRASGTSTCRSAKASMSRARQRFDFRIEVFNILNRTRLGNAVTNPTLADFGNIVSQSRESDGPAGSAVCVLKHD